MSHRVILVAIGGNLPSSGGRSPIDTCRWAVPRLAALPGLHLDACSHWYNSPPQPPSGQPDYVNGAVLLHGEADPRALLDALHGIESEVGRERGEANAARTLDLDLVAMDGLAGVFDGVVLPHPRMHLRGFVLGPVAELAPDWMHPVLHRTAAALLAEVGLQGARKGFAVQAPTGAGQRPGLPLLR